MYFNTYSAGLYIEIVGLMLVYLVCLFLHEKEFLPKLNWNLVIKLVAINTDTFLAFVWPNFRGLKHSVCLVFWF